MHTLLLKQLKKGFGGIYLYNFSPIIMPLLYKHVSEEGKQRGHSPPPNFKKYVLKIFYIDIILDKLARLVVKVEERWGTMSP